MKGEAEGDVREDTGGHKKGYVRRNVKRRVCRNEMEEECARGH